MAVIIIQKSKISVLNIYRGFTNASASLDFAASGGIPITGLVQGGTIKTARLEHVWVEAYVDMIPSLGAKHVKGDTWIRLDGSYKNYTYEMGINLMESVPYDLNSLSSQILSNAVVDSMGNVVSVDTSIIDSELTEQRIREMDYINVNYADIKLDEFIENKKIVKHVFPRLMGTLMNKSTLGYRASELPDHLRHKVVFKIYPDEGDVSVMQSFVKGYNLSELAGKRINIGYYPATEDDLVILKGYLPDYDSAKPINASLLPVGFPAYMVQVKPALMIDDVIAGQGEPLILGSSQKFIVEFSSPAHSNDDIVRNVITAGEQIGIAVVAWDISESEISKVKGLPNQHINDVGVLLYATAFIYCYEVGVADKHYAKSIGLNSAMFSSEAIFKQKVSVETIFGAPVSISSNELIMDVDRYLSVVKAKDGDIEKKLQFMYASGTAFSMLEHQVPEYIFSTESHKVVSISAMKAIKYSAIAGIPFLLLDKNNSEEFLASASIDELAKSDIRNSVNAGKYVFAPATMVTIGDWTGVGYIVIDSVTGSGAYMITDGYGGSRTVVENIVYSIEMYADNMQQLSTGQKAIMVFQDAMFYPTIGSSTSFGISLYQYIKMQIQFRVLNFTVGDKYNHCMAFCSSTKAVGPISSFVMGVLKECFDEVMQELFKPNKEDAGFELADIQANIDGITVPWGTACDDRCLKYYEYQGW